MLHLHLAQRCTSIYFPWSARRAHTRRVNSAWRPIWAVAPVGTMCCAGHKLAHSPPPAPARHNNNWRRQLRSAAPNHLHCRNMSPRSRGKEGNLQSLGAGYCVPHPTYIDFNSVTPDTRHIRHHNRSPTSIWIRPILINVERERSGDDSVRRCLTRQSYVNILLSNFFRLWAAHSLFFILQLLIFVHSSLITKWIDAQRGS